MFDRVEEKSCPKPTRPEFQVVSEVVQLINADARKHVDAGERLPGKEGSHRRKMKLSVRTSCSEFDDRLRRVTGFGEPI